MNSTKDRLNASLAIAGWLQTASPEVAEVLSSCGFHWIVVDMEHGPVAESDVPSIFMAIERHGAKPLVRLPSADPYLARRLLDLGCAGFLIPVVEDADDFMNFARFCFYPPEGCRGLGLSRANVWGKTFDAYTADFRPVLIPQIETIMGAENAADIAALDVVDGLFIGPYDLSADLGKPGDFENAAYIDLLMKIKDACNEAGKVAGIHQVAPDLTALKTKRDEGYRFIAYGTDAIAIRHAFQGLADIK